ncbi:GmrSD restriction endonuclease domain-containing protein [Candidatus Poriferisocius sp.]|uniref:GmrSD restriction endonuclease domain-containing protein n=1 Tax=Candidatus Poriferisocius sp. TaxID=3101276 RepID=UPI003B0179D8
MEQEKRFESNEKPLSDLLKMAASGRLQLPDFQRGWVWDDNHIVSLLASISLSYPIGAVMTLRTGNPDVKFRPRLLEGVELDLDQEPEFMLLDGQQRITSLFLALHSPRPVPTRDARGQDMLRHYYASIDACIDPNEDREDDGIISVPEGRKITTDFGRQVQLDLSSREAEIAAGYFPLDIVFDGNATMDWQVAYLSDGPGESSARLEKWKLFAEAVVKPFTSYQVPAIELAKFTPKEAVCQVFEKVNTGGVSLTVFELLTATFAASEFNLREDWNTRKNMFDRFPVLGQFSATDFLQVVTLLSTYEARTVHIANGQEGDRAPAVSCKRKDVLRLDLIDYDKWADLATEAVLQAVPFLHSEHIFSARDLPYTTQLVPLSAILAELGHEAEGHAVNQLLRQWYWCGVFGEMYGGATETRFANDLQDVIAWIRGGAITPRTVQEAQFQATRLLTLRTRNSAAYKGLYALQMLRGGRDFRTGKPIDVHAYFDDNIDVHHLFPKKWCTSNEIDSGIADSVVNKTAIDARTNKVIGGDAPSRYLAKLEERDRIEPTDLDAIVQSHDVDPLALRQDDFESFFNQRFERLVVQIEEAMGKPANRSAERDESPFASNSLDPKRVAASVKTLIETGESQVVEFKSTALKNLHTGVKDPAMVWSVLKTIAAFMNANGGTLLVGVDDGGAAVGIEEDFPFVSGNHRDGWQLWLTSVVSSSLSETAASELRVTFAALEEKTVARIEVGPSARPVFATPAKGEKKDAFMVRVNNLTKEFQGQDLLDYQAKRWPGVR